MPIYVYECNKCKSITKKRHSIKDKLTDCSSCKSANTLKRVLSSFIKIDKQKAGKVVTSFIEDTKKELKAEKEALKRQEFEE